MQLFAHIYQLKLIPPTGGTNCQLPCFYLPIAMLLPRNIHAIDDQLTCYKRPFRHKKMGFLPKTHHFLMAFKVRKSSNSLTIKRITKASHPWLIFSTSTGCLQKRPAFVLINRSDRGLFTNKYSAWRNKHNASMLHESSVCLPAKFSTKGALFT